MAQSVIRWWLQCSDGLSLLYVVVVVLANIMAFNEYYYYHGDHEEHTGRDASLRTLQGGGAHQWQSIATALTICLSMPNGTES